MQVSGACKTIQTLGREGGGGQLLERQKNTKRGEAFTDEQPGPLFQQRALRPAQIVPPLLSTPEQQLTKVECEDMNLKVWKSARVL